MELNSKKLAFQVGSCLLGILIAGTFGVTALTPPAEGVKYVHAVPEAENAVTCEESTDTNKEFSFVDFKKAGISEYVMTVKQTQKTETVESEAETEIEPFTVEMPEDSTTIYNPLPDSSPCTNTRSTYDEYYTVYDLMSGSTVTLNAHEMVCRICYCEISSSWNEEAIKAQAVAAYSYLRFNAADGAIPTVCLKSGYPSKIESCVSAVEGQCVYYNGSIIDAVYSASSAGCSLASENAWNAAYPYLRAVTSEYDSEDPNYGVEATFTEAKVRKILEKETGLTLSEDVRNWFKINSVRSIRYVGSVSIDSTSVSITGNTMRDIFDLKSAAFTISYADGVFTFTTYGWGHGVGMSQWGASLYADHGYTYDQILRHYYLDTYIAVSDVDEKAVERGKMSQEELEEEIDNSEIVDTNGAADTNAAAEASKNTASAKKTVEAASAKEQTAADSSQTVSESTAENAVDSCADSVADSVAESTAESISEDSVVSDGSEDLLSEAESESANESSVSESDNDDSVDDLSHTADE